MKRLITWLFRRFVYEPEMRMREVSQAMQRPKDYAAPNQIIMFEPAPEWEAQVEKNITKPKVP